MHVTGSFCAVSDTDGTLYINYINFKKKFLKPRTAFPRIPFPICAALVSQWEATTGDLQEGQKAPHSLKADETGLGKRLVTASQWTPLKPHFGGSGSSQWWGIVTLFTPIPRVFQRLDKPLHPTWKPFAPGAQRIFRAAETLLHDTRMVDTRHRTFVKTYRLCNTKSEPNANCGLWEMRCPCGLFDCNKGSTLGWDMDSGDEAGDRCALGQTTTTSLVFTLPEAGERWTFG